MSNEKENKEDIPFHSEYIEIDCISPGHWLHPRHRFVQMQLFTTHNGKTIVHTGECFVCYSPMPPHPLRSHVNGYGDAHVGCVKEWEEAERKIKGV